MNKDLYPSHWREYQLLDSGNKHKLEKFGKFILIRPEPEAIWEPDMPWNDWLEMASARYEENENRSGKWVKDKEVPSSWQMSYSEPSIKVAFRLKFGKFKNIGIFPEQASHWRFIHDAVKQHPEKEPSVLNLFAHTGLASIVAARAGAKVFHVEGFKGFVNDANQNAQLNNISGIHWVVEDVRKFVRREIKRGHRYEGVILDPPSFGMGPSGEKWVIQKHLPGLLKDLAKLIDKKNGFILINTYGQYIPPQTLFTLTQKTMEIDGTGECGALYIPSARDQRLVAGSYYRFKR